LHGSHVLTYQLLVQHMTFKRAIQVSAVVFLALFATAGLTYSGILVLPHRILAPWAHLHAALGGWFMHLLGMHVWTDQAILRTDLHAYAIIDGYHGAGVAIIALLMAAALAGWRRYRLTESLFLIAASLAAALVWNVLRITLILRFGPAPASTAISGLLRDTTAILAIMTMLSVWLNVIVVESARCIRQQRLDPLPGAESGTLSEIPPFWHRVLRRYRHTYVLIPMLAIVVIITYAGRPSRRTRILSELVADMSVQESYDQALRLGHHVATRRPGDVEWQLRLIRIMLLAGRPDEALAALARIPEAEWPDHRGEITLLYAHSYLLMQDEPRARTAWETLRSKADKDPIWHMIFLEFALALGDQKSALELAPQVINVFT